MDKVDKQQGFFVYRIKEEVDNSLKRWLAESCLDGSRDGGCQGQNLPRLSRAS